MVMPTEGATPLPKALITGITGQDGSYLAELLLSKGYQVHGVIRRASTFNTERIDHLYRDPHEPDVRLFLHHGDLTDGTGLRVLLERVEPDEVYNLGAQSHVRISFEQPEYTAEVVAIGALRLLEAVRDYEQRTHRRIRYYQAGSSEMFGNVAAPQHEQTPFRPRSPYGIAKVFAHYQTINYREAYGLFAANGILFNHESARRGETFVSRKITRAAARIALGLQERLYLGNLRARRDWGFAPDYVEAMWLMLQHHEPDDFVIATGESRTVQEFLQAAFGLLNLDWQKHVAIDPRYLRPTEVDHLEGDASKAHRALGWRPRTSFDGMVQVMIEHDLELARAERTLRDAGHRVGRRGLGRA
jgi:GDPmannose 4,6-dehydratase